MIEKEELEKIVGKGNVVDDEKTLEEYSKDGSFVHPMKPRCVVKPKAGEGVEEKHCEEVQRIVKWANETLTPLVPVSSGTPRFRGDTVPSVPGAVVVDLSGMKKIIKIFPVDLTVMIEPGVTFAELIPAVEKEGLRLNMPLLPRSSKSVVGSVLEREPVLMPKYQWDISDPLACTQVIWGTGDYFKTGSAVGPGTIEQQWEAGGGQPFSSNTQFDPHRLIQGSQGTMGIVTWATIRCELLPKLQELFMVGSSDLGSLMELSHLINKQRLANECLILNNANLAAIFARKADEFTRLRDALPPWVLFYSVVGYDYFPEDRIAYQKKQIMDMAKQTRLEPVTKLGEVSASELLKLLQKPSDEPYWKLRYKGACQDIFFLSNSGKVSEFVAVMHDEAERHGHPVAEMGVYLQPIVQGVGWHCEFNSFYDPKDVKGVARVRELLSDASEAVINKGAFFSRPYGLWADLAYHRDGKSAEVLKKVKGIFDPNNVMNPGKLCF